MAADKARRARRDEMVASIEREFDVEDEVEALEAEYRRAQKKYQGSDTDANREAFKAAKQAFVDRRNELRDMQAANPYHPRQPRTSVVGVSSGTVTYDDGTTEER